MSRTTRMKYVAMLPLFVVASTVLQLTHVVPTYAASITWTGAGDGTTFSDQNNWSTGAVPTAGDALTFDVTGLTEQKVLNDDIAGLSLSGITFTGNTDQYYSYTLQGDDITLTGSVANTTTGTGMGVPTIQNNLTLGADVTVSNVNLGDYSGSGTVNLGAHSLNYAGTAQCGMSIYSALSGSGALTLSGQQQNLRGTNTSFTGPINVTGKAAINVDSFGSTAAGTTVSGSGTMILVSGSSVNTAEPLTLGGTGAFGVGQSYYGCAGGAGETVTVTATGGVTLTSDFLYNGSDNFTIQTPYTTNGHAFTVAGGAAGTLTTPNGAETAPTETIQLDGDSTTFVNIGKNQTGVLNGTRDGIGVQDGGVLKGTGTANNVYISTGGVIAPGNSPGTLTVLDSFSLSGTYNAEVLNSGSYDKLAVGKNYSGSDNAVSLYSGSKLNVVLYDGWAVNKGDAFTIIDNQSSTAVSGTFDNLAEGTQFVVDGITFSISYVGGDGNDVVITALNTGTDPGAPNTGAMKLVLGNPLLVAVLGLVAAGFLGALALRRKANR